MATAAAAAIIRREQDIVEHFRRLGADRPEAAQAFDALGVQHGVAWRRLVDDAVIRTATDGKFYFDEATWEALGRRRRRLMTAMLLIVALVLALALALITTAKGRA